MSRRNTRSLPPGGRLNGSSGRITLMFAVEEGGTTRRLSQNKILSSEPRSYGTPDEAWEGYHRVRAFLDQEIDRAATVGGFFDRWSDEDDPEFGAGGLETPNRGRHAIHTYASKVRPFAAFYANRTLASLNDKDIRAWVRNSAYVPSSMTAIRTFLFDAERAGLRSGQNPAVDYAEKAHAKLRRDRPTQPPVPSYQQCEQMLAFAHRHMPIGLYGWLLCGVRTGMRCSEIDGMQLRYLNRDTGVYDIQWQLHPVTRQLDEPKHGSRRKVFLPPDVLALIDEIHPRVAVAENDGDADFIWLNTFYTPWEDSSRLKWWDKQVAGSSLREKAGDVPIKNATRHYWATLAVNSGKLALWDVATLFGHKDGGKLIAKTYARRDEDAALEAARQMHERMAQTRPNLRAIDGGAA